MAGVLATSVDLQEGESWTDRLTFRMTRKDAAICASILGLQINELEVAIAEAAKVSDDDDASFGNRLRATIAELGMRETRNDAIDVFRIFALKIAPLDARIDIRKSMAEEAAKAAAADE